MEKMKNNKWRRIPILMMLVFALCVTSVMMLGFPVSASASADNNYVAADGTSVAMPTDATAVTGSDTVWATGWYVVDGNVEITGDILVAGEVNLVLKEGCSLTITGTINANSGNTLAIYGQSGNTGTMNVEVNGESEYVAVDVSELIINGGTVNVTATCLGANTTYGIRCDRLSIKGGAVNVSATQSAANLGSATGIFSIESVEISGGTVNVSATQPERDAYGIDSPDAKITGGTVTLNVAGRDAENTSLFYGALSVDGSGTLVLPSTMSKTEVLALGITGTGGIKYGNVHINTNGDCITHNWTAKISQKDTTCHYTEVCTICNTTNEATVASCEYDNACDTNCNICKIVRTIEHTYDANGFCTVCRYSDTPAVDSDGDGLLEIDSVGKLWWFTHQVKAGQNDLNAELTANIDLSGTCGDGIGNWKPISHSDGYKGHFNGQGFTVSNLYIESDEQYAGLFGYVKGATIENVTVTGRVSSTFSFIYYPDTYEIFEGAAGGIAAYLNGGTIRNCHVNMTVSGGYKIGGICGKLDSDGLIENCTTLGSAQGGEDVNYIGGIVGDLWSGTVRGCTNAATVGNILEPANYAGGIAGANFGIIENCLNFGNVEIAGTYGGHGGITGNQGIDCIVRNCGNYGTVSGYCTGGIVADNCGIIENCYNVGTVSGTSEYVDSIANSRGDYASVTNNYYLSDEATDDGGRTAEQFVSGQVAYELNGSTTTDESVWKQTLGTDSYPTLTGENVYYVTFKKCDGTVIGQIYSNSSSIIYHDDASDDSFCDLCGWIIISEITFPDANFRTYISENIDTDSDGVLSPEEIAAVTAMDVSSKGITDLTGIEYFTGLITLNANYNYGLTSIDISALTELVNLELISCKLTSINLENNTKLEYADLSSTCLTSLDLSKNINLDTIDVSGTMLTELDLSNNPNAGLLRGENTSYVSLKHCGVGYVDMSQFGDVSRMTIVSGGTLVDGWLKLDADTSYIQYEYDTRSNPNIAAYFYVGIYIRNNDIEHTYVEGYTYKDATHHYAQWCETCHTADETAVEAHADSNEDGLCDACGGYTFTGAGTEDDPYVVTNIGELVLAINMTENEINYIVFGNDITGTSITPQDTHKTLVLDLKGYTLNIPGGLGLNNISTVQNGSINGGVYAYADALVMLEDLTVNGVVDARDDSTVLIENCSIIGSEVGALVAMYGAEMIVNDVTITIDPAYNLSIFRIAFGSATLTLDGVTYTEKIGENDYHTHKDEDGDCVCDRAGDVLHTDENSDYFCEVCGSLFDENVFFDPDLWVYMLANFDADDNDTLSPTEIASVTSIDLRGVDVIKISGIEHFTNLTELKCNIDMLWYTMSYDLSISGIDIGKVTVQSGAVIGDLNGKTVLLIDEGETAVVGTYALFENGTPIALTLNILEPHTHKYEDVVWHDFVVTPATCTTGTIYYKSCECGKTNDETFEDVDRNSGNHTGTNDKLVPNGVLHHNVVWSCCDAVVTENVDCTASNADGSCLTAETCACSNLLIAAKDSHELTYTASGNVITETCGRDGCAHTATATLHAPENPVYNGTQKLATVTYSDDWKGDDLMVGYSGTANDGSSYAGIVYPAVKAGTVTASITAQSYDYTVATASVEYTIEKAPVTVGIVSVESPEAIYPHTALGSIVITRTNTTIPGTLALNAGQTLTVGTQEYNWTWTPDDTDNYKETTGTIELTVVEDVLQGIAITTEPIKTEYTYGDTFDKTDMVVTATYASGAAVDVTDLVTIESEILTVATTSVSISYEGFTVTQAITVNPMVIGKTNMALTTLYWEYTGEPITVYFTVWGYKYEEVPASEYTVTYSNNTEIGQATVTFTDNPGGNYEVNATLTFNIVEAELKDVSVSQNGTLTYTGNAQTPTVNSSATTVDGTAVTFTYCLTEDGTYTAELPTFTNAGTYTVYFKANAANHEESSGSFEVVVNKATNEWTEAPSITGWTYGEYENTPTATPKFGEVDFSSFAYRLKGTVAWSNIPPTEVGIYELRTRVQATDNWELLETTIEFEVAKADPTTDLFTFTPPANLDVCDGSAKEATVTAKDGVTGVGSITVKYFKNGEALTGAPTTVGTYTVKIDVAEGANFLASEGFLTTESWTFTFDVTDEATHKNVTLSSNENGTHNKVCSACEKVIESNITCSGTTTDDCDKGYKCSCGGYFGTKEHDFSGDYLSDSEGHWHECADCGATDTKTAHTPENDDGSCLTEIKCSACNYVTTEAKNDHGFDNDCDTTCGNKGCTHTREITHTPREDDGDCTTAIHCAVCDAMTTPGNPSHDFDNTCDTDCNRTNCNHIRTITHTPDDDDGSCLTEVLCSICNAVTTAAKNEHGFDNSCDTTCGNKGCTHTREITHTPRDDDGDCTTAIHCAVCDALLTIGNPSHDFDNSCDTDCNRTGCNYTRTITHVSNEDDGNCLTEVRCSICNAVTTPANEAHTGGTATCQAQANCSVCGTAYGELASHSFTVAQSDKNQHWNKCSTCEETDTKADHIDSDSNHECDICDAWLTPFEKVSLSLGDDLAVNYFIAKGNFTEPQIRFTINGYTKTVDGVLVDEQFKFVFDGVAPQWIGDTITAELIIGGEVVEVKEYSVLRYLNTLKAKTAAELGISEAKYKTMQTLIADLLVYGGAAQNYTEHNTGALVSNGITGSTFKEIGSTDASKKDGSYVTFKGATVFYDSVNTLRFKFESDDLTGVVFKIKVNNGPEETVEYVNNGDNTYTITTAAIFADRFDDVYTVTAYKDGVADAKLTYSVKSYVYSKQDGTDNIAALAKATYNYGISAKAYKDAE